MHSPASEWCAARRERRYGIAAYVLLFAAAALLAQAIGQMIAEAW